MLKRNLSVIVALSGALALGACASQPSGKEGDEAGADKVEMLSPAEEWQDHACEAGEPTKAAAVYQPKTCRSLDAAANEFTVDTSEPAVAQFRSIWRRVYDPYLSLTGREATLRLVPGDAMKNTPAMTCPGPTPTVYFSKDVIDQTLVDEKYPESFLAFIAGHELGHRLNDYSCEGASTSFGGNSREVLADLRAAYFTTIAGYSTRELAEDNVVDAFLKAEAAVRGEARKERRGALKEALESYPLYEAIYQNGITLSLSHAEQLMPAARLVGWADELMTIESVPVPEFKLLRALVLMRSAIADAPWIDGVGELSKSAANLRCTPVMATHTALQEDIKPGDSLMGPKGRGIEERRRAVKNLELALEWTNHAENRFGASSLIAGNLRSCIRFYLDDPEMALIEQKRAMKNAGELPATVKDALAGNEALFKLAAFTAENERPNYAEELPEWQKKLSAMADKLTAHDGVATVVAEATGSGPAKVEEPASREVDPKATAILADAGLIETDLSSKLGDCPEASTRKGMLPAKETADNTGASYGITFCRPDGEGRVRMISRVRLSEALEPAYDQVQVDILSVSPAKDATVDNLLARCPTLERKTVAPDGAQVYAGSCDGEGDTVVFVRGDKVERIDVIRRAEDS